MEVNGVHQLFDNSCRGLKQLEGELMMSFTFLSELFL